MGMPVTGCDGYHRKDVTNELPIPVNGTKLPNNFSLFAVRDIHYDSRNPPSHFGLYCYLLDDFYVRERKRARSEHPDSRPVG